MPEYLEDLRTGIITVINATWPDLTAIDHPQELARIPWERATFPRCVLDLNPVPYHQGARTAREDLVTTTISRVMKDNETRAELLEHLESLRLAFWPDNRSHPVTDAQVMEYPQVTDSMALPVNSFFLNSGRPYYCGAVIVKIRAGYLP